MKSKLTMIALGTLAILTGCARSETIPGTTLRLSVRMESPETRATVHETTGAFAWTNGDQIAVHLSSGYVDAALTADGTNQYGTTELAITDDNVTRTGYAIFPAGIKDVTADGVGTNLLKVTLPSSYNGVSAVTATSTPVPMVAVNDPDSDLLYFHHVGGLVRIEGLSLPSGTSSVKVTFNRGVNGSFEVADRATSAPKISNVQAEGSNNSVTFNLTGTLPTVLNVPVPCGEYAWVKVYVDAATDPSHTFDGFTLARSQGIKLTVPDPEP